MTDLTGKETIQISYLICTTPRSGSNFLCEVLDSTGIAGHPQEYFWNPPFWYAQWGVSDFPSYFRRILQEGSTPNGIFGMKMMWYELEEFLPQLAHLLHKEDAPLSEQLSTAFPNLRYIWLTRRDKVRQAISQHRGEQTKIWRSTDARKVVPVEPTFDWEAIDGLRGWLVEGDAFWRNYFATNDIQPLTVVYEELAQHPYSTAVEILQYLEVPVPDELSFGKWQHEKQADALSEEWVQRYQERKQTVPESSP